MSKPEVGWRRGPAGRPGWSANHRPAPNRPIFGWVTGSWALLPKSVVSESGPFDPCEAEWHALIGRRLLPWIEECVSLLLKCVFCLISPTYK